MENPDNLPPYWKELKYRQVSGPVFRGPPPKFELMVCAETTHRLLKENLVRLAAFKAQPIAAKYGVDLSPITKVRT